MNTISVAGILRSYISNLISDSVQQPDPEVRGGGPGAEYKCAAGLPGLCRRGLGARLHGAQSGRPRHEEASLRV